MRFYQLAATALFVYSSVAHAGLTGHWRLNGNANDSGGIYTGVFTGTESYTAGPIGSAAAFDGSSYINLGDAVMPVGAYTKSAWIYRTADGPNNILSGGSAHAFWCSSANASRLAAGHNGAWATVQSDQAVPLNTWLHVAVTYDPAAAGGTLRLFTNGVPVAGVNGVATAVATHGNSTARIGAYGTANFFSGRIDDVGLWDQALAPASILAIYTAGLSSNDIATLWLTAPPVTVTDMPKPMQVYPRTLPGNTATIALSGTVNTNGHDAAVLTVYRDDLPFLVNTQALVYAGDKAPFTFSPAITAELASFDFELSILRGTNRVSVRRVNDVAVGDVYIIQGQSNADANMYNGTANGNQHPFLRTFGMNSNVPATTTANQSWLMASGDGSLGKVGGVGQWGLRMGRLLVDTHQVPVAILNGAHGGKPIGFFQRNDANHEDLNTNYGRLLYRARLAGVTNGIRAVLWYQGESDGGAGATHENGFTILYQDWKEDYPGIERVYVHQLRVGCGVTKNDVDLRDRQRRLQDTFADISVISTTGLNGHDGCHYAYETGYKILGNHNAALLGRDLYGAPDAPNIDAPNIATATFADATRRKIVVQTRNVTDQLVFDPGCEADWIVNGAAVTVTSGVATNNRITLTLSDSATGATGITYTGHAQSGPWVTNALGVGLLTFSAVPFAIPTTPPGAPTNVVGEGISSGRVRLSWDNVTNATSFAVRRDGVFVGTAAALTFTDTGLTALTSYEYTVAGVNALGTSAWSSAVSVMTLEPLPVPETPLGFAAVASSSSAVALSWEGVSNAVWYVVRRDDAVVLTSGTTNAIDIGLAPATRYDYAIAAANDSGTSAWSSVVSVTTATISVYANVPESVEYELVYVLEIPEEGNFRNATPVPYSLDRHAAITGYFDRVAYYLELDGSWVYASMDAFTPRAKATGLPHTPNNPVFFQTSVSNLHVAASAGANVATGEVATGNIEFWPNNYSTANGAGVPGASPDTYDFGDELAATVNPGYGSFQVHNTDIGETVFAYNRWGAAGTSDIGIGNQPTGHPDWTFAQNAAAYTTRRLYVLVRPGELPPPPAAPAGVTVSKVSVYSAELNWQASVGATGYIVRVGGLVAGTFTDSSARLVDLAPQAVHKVDVAAVGFGGVSAFTEAAFTTGRVGVYANVPEALDYEVIYELEIENDGVYQNTSLPPYSRDRAAALTQPFDRVAYYLELGGDWVFVSMDSFTTEPAHLALAHNTLNVFFQQPVSNMNVVASAGSPVTPTNGCSGGWIEFWPNNYGPANTAGVPGASPAVFDFGDERNAGVNPGYGCLQVHNVSAGEVLLAYNRWGNGGGDDCIGIGNNTVEASPGVVHTDWTFRNNAAAYALKRLYVLARLGADADGDGLDDAWERRELGGTHAGAKDDSDGDSADNEAEYVAGTDAGDRESLPRLMIASGANTLEFESVSERMYRILYRTNLTETQWHVLGTNMPGTGHPISLTDTNTQDRQRFYRLGIRR